MIQLEYPSRILQYSNFLLLDSMIWRCNKYLAILVFSGSAVSYGCLFFKFRLFLSQSGDFELEKTVAVGNSSAGQLE